jgi:hypothetical protein
MLTCLFPCLPTSSSSGVDGKAARLDGTQQQVHSTLPAKPTSPSSVASLGLALSETGWCASVLPLSMAPATRDEFTSLYEHCVVIKLRTYVSIRHAIGHQEITISCSLTSPSVAFTMPLPLSAIAMIWLLLMTWPAGTAKCRYSLKTTHLFHHIQRKCLLPPHHTASSILPLACQVEKKGREAAMWGGVVEGHSERDGPKPLFSLVHVFFACPTTLATFVYLGALRYLDSFSVPAGVTISTILVAMYDSWTTVIGYSSAKIPPPCI